MNLNITDEAKDLIARSWIRHQSAPETRNILDNRLPEPDYKQVLSVDGDKWPYKDSSPVDVIFDLDFEAPDIAYDIVLKIAEITDDESLLGLLAAGHLEDLISHHEEAEKYLTKYKKLAASSAKHKRLLSMVWF